MRLTGSIHLTEIEIKKLIAAEVSRRLGTAVAADQVWLGLNAAPSPHTPQTVIATFNSTGMDGTDIG